MSGVAAATALTSTSCNATGVPQDDGEETADFLFVQNAQVVTLEGGVLTMAEVGRDTLYFSDRPDRIVGRETTQEFVEQWGTGADSFEANPPNAVLSITHGSKLEDIVVVLMNPRLVDADLVYDVEVLDGEERASGVGAFFIDSIGRPLTPVSVAGTTRRVARRTTRRVVRRT